MKAQDTTPSSQSAPETDYERRVRQEIHRHPAENEPDPDPEEEQQTEGKPKKRKWVFLKHLFTGTILVQENVTKRYLYLGGIAVMFFVSIAVLFLSLQLDLTCTNLEREVRVLRAKAVTMESRRYHRTTHTAIVNQLRQAGSALKDPDLPPRVLHEEAENR